MQHQKKWTKFKKLSNAAHDLSSLGCDADNSKFLNPLSSSDNQLYNEPLQCVTFIGRIENFETEIIIDSGSGVSIIGLELFTLINKHAKSPYCSGLQGTVLVEPTTTFAFVDRA